MDLREQIECLSQRFPILTPESILRRAFKLPKNFEDIIDGFCVLPNFYKKSADPQRATQIFLEEMGIAINWRDCNTIPHTAGMLQQIGKEQPGEMIIIGCCLGAKFAGCSADEVREFVNQPGSGMFALDVVNTASILSLHPSRLDENALCLDAPGTKTRHGQSFYFTKRNDIIHISACIPNRKNESHGPAIGVRIPMT
jgi:hypothetical protein